MQEENLTQVADELYQLDPAGFRAARDERANQARATGDRELSEAIKKLRRPTVSAWMVNRLVHEASDEVDRLLELGESLREAQQSLEGDRLRELSAPRRQLVRDLTQEAKRLAAQAQQRVSDQAEREVEATLEAALADPAAAEAVRSGRLTTGLSYAGLGGVDIEQALAVPAARPGRSRAARKEVDADASARRRQEAERELREASAAATEAEAELDGAQRQLTEASERHEEVQRRISGLEQQLEEAEEEQARTARVLRDATRRRDVAARSADVARRHLDQAQAKLDRQP